LPRGGPWPEDYVQSGYVQPGGEPVREEEKPKEKNPIILSMEICLVNKTKYYREVK